MNLRLRRSDSVSGSVLCENVDGPNRAVSATQSGPDHLIDYTERG